jgi:predicted AAA+ superfamily ATPase
LEGGFPEAQGISAQDRYQLLQSYVDVVLLRDVIERYDVSHPVALRWMVRYLLGNAAGLFSVHKMHNDLRSQGFAVGKDTVYAYLGYLEDAFLVQSIDIAASSERQRMVNPRKVYPVDASLIPLFDRTGRANVGHALETCVFWELQRRGAEVHYVRTASSYEVDFLARYWDGREELIQVCTDLTDEQTAGTGVSRAGRGIAWASVRHARANHPLSRAVNPPPEGITVQTALDWFLQTR